MPSATFLSAPHLPSAAFLVAPHLPSAAFLFAPHFASADFSCFFILLAPHFASPHLPSAALVACTSVVVLVAATATCVAPTTESANNAATEVIELSLFIFVFL
ncbi:hypothetical protein J806_3252 [Acinetobacter sp. 25977_3]|nr:hypothetical protein J806_3252 [Acinetobacter sp. 25977_3]